jgi:hypothetical protein
MSLDRLISCPLDIYAVMELLGYMTVLLLIFEEPPCYFP